MGANLPAETDLIDFFGVEPRLLDADTPWIYNTITFALDRAGYAVVFEIAPAYETLRISIADGHAPLASAELRGFKAVRLDREAGRAALIVERAGTRLVLVLEPVPSLVVSSNDGTIL